MKKSIMSRTTTSMKKNNTTKSIARKYKPYPAYKDSGVEWLGEIPACPEWNIVPIRELARSGYKTFIDGDWIEAPYIRDEGIRLIQTGNIGIGEYKEQGYRFIDEKTFIELQCTEVTPGDVLICRLADPVGRACLAPNLDCRMITSVDVCILKSAADNDPRYIVYALSGKQYLSYLESICRGGTRDRVSRSMLGAIRVQKPEIHSQEKIASFLDLQTSKIDALSAKYQRLLELLAEKRSALISRAVTKGLDPDAPMKDSGVEWLGEIPEGWITQRLKYLVQTNPESLPEDTDPNFTFIYIDIGSVDEKEGIGSSEEMIFGSAPSRARRIVRENDLIISTVRTYLRAIAQIQKCEDNIIVSTGFAVLRCIDILPKFLRYALAAPYFIEKVVAYSTGIGYPAINESTMSCFPIALPGPKEQKEIAVQIDRETSKIDALVAKVERAVELLKEYRFALISAAVTGKIDLREESA